MQNYLNKLTLPSTRLRPTEFSAPKLKPKVIAFQNAHSLTPDGKIGEKTWDKIIALID